MEAWGTRHRSSSFPLQLYSPPHINSGYRTQTQQNISSKLGWEWSPLVGRHTCPPPPTPAPAKTQRKCPLVQDPGLKQSRTAETGSRSTGCGLTGPGKTSWTLRWLDEHRGCGAISEEGSESNCPAATLGPGPASVELPVEHEIPRIPIKNAWDCFNNPKRAVIKRT